MKKLAKLSLVLSGTALLLAGCNCYNGIQKNIKSIGVKCTPSVLSLQGSNVTTDLTVTFPPQYFKKTAILKITPVLVFAEGETVGTPKFLQGETVKNNYTVIPYQQGGSYTQTVTFPYDERAKLSKLELRIEAMCFSRCPEQERPFETLATITAADGVSMIQRDASWADYMSLMKDNYKETTTESKDASILYQIGKAEVKQTALTTSQLQQLKAFIQENEAKGTIQIKGYASPDGPLDLNENLAKKRSETGKEAFSKEINDPNVKYDISSYGEDWDGFKELVQSSDIQDKALILQVLSMYDSPVKREAEIKNMSAVFKTLAEEILPQLRRAKVVVDLDVQNKSNTELKSAVSTNLNAMDVEEMLRAATLYDNLNEKGKVYKAAADKYKDARAYNNLGVVLAQQGKFKEAKTALDQAAKIKDAPEISNNLGVVALAQGDVAGAKKYISALNSADAKRNKALITLAEGDYSAASKELTGYNLAVAQVLDGNLSGAKSTLNSINTAKADYLRAEIAMREGDSTAALANLKSACQKDASLKAAAKQNAEFAKLFASPEFQAL